MAGTARVTGADARGQRKAGRGLRTVPATLLGDDMKTWCERQGQVEVGVIEHEGRCFTALGASVVGRHVTGYTNVKTGDNSLTTWCGRTMLACRSEVVEEYRDGSLALMFRLTRGRFIVGYALGDKGMLFRGELITDSTDDEAGRAARELADYFAEIDADDESRWEEEQH